MKLFGIQDSNFYTEEHCLNNYVFFTDSLQKAQEYVLKKFEVQCAEGETVVYCEDHEEYGELSVTIELIKVQ